MSTLTVYPSLDGYVGKTSVGSSFATVRDGSGDEANDSATTAYGPQIGHHTTSNTYSIIRRLITLFDTSALGSSANISAATLSYYFVTRSNTYIGGEYNVLVTSNPASTSALASSDYNVANWGTTELMTRQTWASITLNAYTDYTLNASGLAAISKTGITKLGLRTAVDLDNGATWQSGVGDYLESRTADYTGTSSDPKLVITYTSSTNYTQSVTDSVTIGEAIGTSRIYAKNVLESLTISEVNATIKGQYKAITEALTIGEANIRAITRAILDSITTSDTVAGIKVLVGSVVESITTSDAYSYTRGWAVTISESVTIAEAKIASIAHSIVESITTSDTIGATRLYFKSIIESITLAVAVVTTSVRSLRITESITLREAPMAAKNGMVISLRYFKKFANATKTYIKKYINYP